MEKVGGDNQLQVSVTQIIFGVFYAKLEM